QGSGIAVDASGSAYVTGYTSSTNFPTANALQPTLGGGYNAFVAKISPIVVGDFTGTFDTFNQRVAPGQSAVYNLTIIPLNGFTSNVTLAASNLPVGTTVSFAPQTVKGGSGTTAITVQTSTFTPQNCYDITLTATSGTLVHSTAITINVAVNGDFIGSFNQSTATATPSTPATYVLTLTPLQGFNANVTLSAFGLPNDATATFSPAVVSGGNGTTTLTVSVASDSRSGTYPLTITGSTPGLSHSTSITLVAQAQVGDFSGTFNLSSASVTPGGQAAYSLTLTPSGGFNGNVSLSASGVPQNATATFSPAIVNGGSGSSTLTISTASNTPPGTYQITVTGTSGVLVHWSVLTFIVQSQTTGDFSGTFDHSVASVSIGGSTTYILTLTPSGGFTGNVTLTASGVPQNATATFSPAVVNGGSGSSTLTIATSSTTPSGNYQITVTGTSGALVHSTVLTLLAGTVDFTGTITPTSQTVIAGGSVQYTIQLTTLGTVPFGNLVTLSIVNLPAGVTASFSSPTINPDANGTSVLTLQTSPSGITPAGNFLPLLTATGGGVTHAANLGLTVTF
ncbi:MAG: beta strand repeat-containing protein, partial [Thermoguttaceae bacterium]